MVLVLLPLVNTQLVNRELCFDGSSIVNKDFLYDFILSGNDISEHKIFIDRIDDEVKQYNSEFDDILQVRTSTENYNYSWNIPEKYLNLNVREYIIGLLTSEAHENHLSDADINIRLRRTLLEIRKWERHNLNKLLCTLIYIIDTFRENDIVWGTGRGSSCCCYILYLIGVHDVDSILYDLDLTEFFR